MTRADSGLRRLANDHWLAAYEALIASIGGEWRHFGNVAAFVSPNVPVPFANGCLVLEPGTADDLAAAAQWVRAADVPYRIRIDTTVMTDQLAIVALGSGTTRSEWDMPGMVLRPLPAAPPPAPGISVERVRSDNHRDFIALLVESGLPHAVALAAFGPPEADPDMAMFVAYLDSTLAGTSVAYRTGSTTGVYTVGTIEAARGRGVGSAATWAVIDQAREWGCDAVVLQSSQMGLRVYERIGFKSVVAYAVYSSA